MKFNNDTYTVAENTLKSIKSNNANIKIQREQEIYSKSNEIREIDNTINSTGLNVVKAVLETDKPSELIEGLKLRNEQLLQKKQLLLMKLGYDKNYLNDIYSCEKCKDKGVIAQEKCVCFKNILAKTAFVNVNEQSPLKYSEFKNFHLDFFENKNSSQYNPREKMGEILAYCQEYTRYFSLNSPSILMVGGTGLGKTHLSMSIAKDVMEKGFGVVHGTANSILNAIEVEHFNRENKRETLNATLACDLLIIDDLGSEYSTNFTVATIYNVINTRLSNSKPTIISTNLDFKGIEKQYTSKITSRVAGGYVTLAFQGTDIRIYKKSKGLT